MEGEQESAPPALREPLQEVERGQGIDPERLVGAVYHIADADDGRQMIDLVISPSQVIKGLSVRQVGPQKPDVGQGRERTHFRIHSAPCEIVTRTRSFRGSWPSRWARW